MAKSRIRQINWADNTFYDYFYGKFDRLVNNFGKEKMDAEVEILKKRTKIWFDYCVEEELEVKVNNASTVIRFNNKHASNKTCWILTGTVLNI